MEQLCNKGIKRVCCGTQFSVALACDGHVYTFGQGIFYCEHIVTVLSPFSFVLMIEKFQI